MANEHQVVRFLLSVDEYPIQKQAVQAVCNRAGSDSKDIADRDKEMRFEVIKLLVKKLPKNSEHLNTVKKLKDTFLKQSSVEKVEKMDMIGTFADFSFNGFLNGYLYGKDGAYAGLKALPDEELVAKLMELASYIKSAFTEYGDKSLEEKYSETISIIEECMQSGSMTELSSLSVAILTEYHPISVEKEIIHKLAMNIFHNDNGPINIAMTKDVHDFLSMGPVFKLLNDIFESPFTPEYFFSANAEYVRDTANFRYKHYSQKYHLDYRLHLRYIPLAMMMLEGICKFITLMLIATVVAHTNSKTLHSDLKDMKWCEILLFVQGFFEICYEFGQLSQHHWSLQDFFDDDPWNILDAAGILPIILWGIFRLNRCTGEDSYCTSGAIVLILSLAAIPLAISVLRYMSVSKPLGTLVIMIFGLLFEISLFMVIFFLSILGFGIVFSGFFREIPEFSSLWNTVQTLFSASVGNFDLSVFDQGYFRNFGQFLLIVFVIWSLILLLNLVIARMTQRHDDISKNATSRHAFNLANHCEQFLLMKESSVLCMLPPPLNLIPIMFGVVHYYLIYTSIRGKKDKVISLAGFVCDKILGVISIVFFVIYDYVMMFVRQFTKTKYRKKRVTALTSKLLRPITVALYSLTILFYHDPPLQLDLSEFLQKSTNWKRLVYSLWFDALPILFRVDGDSRDLVTEVVCLENVAETGLFTRKDKDRIFGCLKKYDTGPVEVETSAVSLKMFDLLLSQSSVAELREMEKRLRSRLDGNAM